MFLATALMFCGVLSAGEVEYVLSADDTPAWTVLKAYPGSGGWNYVRLMTNPPSGHPGILSRLAVFRGGKLLGFVRIRQPYSGGCVVGRMGRSMDPSNIRSDDLLKTFELAVRDKVIPQKLRSRERRRIEKAVSELGHDAYSVRQKATVSLKSRGKEVLPFITKLCDSDDPEIMIRANDIFDSIMARERVIEPGLATVLLRATGQNKPENKRGFLGISMSDVEKGTSPGTLILGVVEDTPAEKIGLRAGDVILSVDDEILNDSTDLLELISSRNAGDRVKLVIKREKEEMEIEVKLMGRPTRQTTIRR